MTLKGSLEVLNLSDIFQSLSLNQHTGTLRVTDGRREKLVHFAQGEITLLASEKKVKIGEMLVAAGKISAEDLEYALQQQKKSKKKLGEVLVEEGFISEDDIGEIVKQQIEAEIYDLFLWKKADFEFLIDYIPEKLKNPSHGITKLQFNTSSLIMEALRRLDEWGLISKEISTLKEVYKVVNTSPAALEDIDLPDRVKAEVKLIDGEKSLEQIADDTSLSEFELCKLVYELKSRGIVAPLTPQELSEKADESFEKGRFRQAASLYERLVDQLPKNLSIRWHYAEASKALGDEKRAVEQFEFVAQQLEGTRDRLELAKAYRAILDIAQDRKDILEKLRALDKAKWQQGLFKTVAIAVVVLAAAAGAFFALGSGAALAGLKEKIAGLFASSAEGGAKKVERDLQETLKQLKLALDTGDPRKAFDLGRKALEAHGDHALLKDLRLPITIRSDPPGKVVWIDGERLGATDGVFLFAAAKGKETITVELREEGESGRVLLGPVEVGVAEFADRKFDLFRSPVWVARTQGAVRGAPIFRNQVAFFTSFDGNLHGRLTGPESDKQGPVLTDPLSQGSETFGFASSGLALCEDIVAWGTVDGDVRGFNLGLRSRLFAVHLSDQPLLAPPVVTDGGQTVAVAGDDGVIRFVAVRRQGALLGQVAMGSRVTAGLAAAGNLVFAAGRDNRVIAIDENRRQLWDYDGRADYTVAPLPVSESALVAGDIAGEVVALERTTGAVLWRAALGASTGGLATDGDTVYATASGGELSAFEAATGNVRWKASVPKSPGRPVVAGEVVVTGGETGIVAIERGTGVERWAARAKSAFRGEPVFSDGLVYIGNEDGGLYAFEP